MESDISECNADVDDERESEIESECDSELESRLRFILSARRLQTIVSDIRGIAVMVLLLVVLQMSNDRTDDHFDDDDSYDDCAAPRLHRHTKIQYYWRGALNDDDNDGEEKIEHEDDDVEDTEEETRRTLNFDVTTTLFDASTNMVIQSKSFGHAIRVNDLYFDEVNEMDSAANAQVRDVARNMYSDGNVNGP